jgi:hypothetical protein
VQLRSRRHRTSPVACRRGAWQTSQAWFHENVATHPDHAHPSITSSPAFPSQQLLLHVQCCASLNTRRCRHLHAIQTVCWCLVRYACCCSYCGCCCFSHQMRLTLQCRMQLDRLLLLQRLRCRSVPHAQPLLRRLCCGSINSACRTIGCCSCVAGIGAVSCCLFAAALSAATCLSPCARTRCGDDVKRATLLPAAPKAAHISCLLSRIRCSKSVWVDLFGMPGVGGYFPSK